MNTNASRPGHRGHAHDVDLDDTFDFLNTDDTENGFPVEKLPTLDDALDWFVDRGVIHVEGADRVRAQAAASRPADGRDLARSMPSGRRCARSPGPIVGAARAATPALARDDQPGAPRAPGHRARPGTRRLHRRPPPRRRPDRRRAGPPGRPARDELTDGSPGTDQDLRQRHLRVDLLRRLTDEPPALVRHGDLRQPRQGRASPGAGARRRSGRAATAAAARAERGRSSPP